MKNFASNESGASLVEYGLLVGLIAIVAIASVQTLGAKVAEVFQTITDKLNAAGI